MIRRALLAVVLGLAVAGGAAAQDPDSLPTVDSVNVQGNQFLDPATLLFYVSTKPGERYDERRLKDDFRRVWETGFVDDLLLDVRDTTGQIPHIYFEWTEGNPFANFLRFFLFGQGEVAPVTREVLREAGVSPITLEAKEGLALNNGTQVQTGIGILAFRDTERAVETAEVAAAMSLEGLRGTPDPFHAAIQRARPHIGQTESANRLRALLQSSEIRKPVSAKVRTKARSRSSIRSLVSVSQCAMIFSTPSRSNITGLVFVFRM